MDILLSIFFAICCALGIAVLYIAMTTISYHGLFGYTWKDSFYMALKELAFWHRNDDSSL